LDTHANTLKKGVYDRLTVLARLIEVGGLSIPERQNRKFFRDSTDDAEIFFGDLGLPGDYIGGLACLTVTFTGSLAG